MSTENTSEVEKYLSKLQIETHKQELEKSGFLDYSQFVSESAEPWQDIYDNSLPLSQNLISILRQSVLLPRANIQVPIAVAYMLIPSALAKVVPILFSHGQAGTGKSTVGFLAAQVHGITLCTSGDTFASIRNFLSAQKWVFPDSQRGERNCMLVWDDIDEQLFATKPDIYRMLKVGYDKSSDIIRIAGANGENLEFRVFSPKITSSIQGLHNHPKYPEIQRRCLVLKHKKLELFSLGERIEAGLDDDFSFSDQLNLKAIDWEGFDWKFRELWTNVENCKRYAEIRKKLTSRGKKSFKLGEHVNSDKWTISVDLCCAGIVSGVWSDINEGVEAISAYWKWHKENIADENGAMMKLLREFIEKETQTIRETNQRLGYLAVNMEVSPEKLKNQLAFWQSRGELDMNPKVDVVVSVMGQLGWRLEPGKWVEDK